MYRCSNYTIHAGNAGCCWSPYSAHWAVQSSEPVQCSVGVCHPRKQPEHISAGCCCPACVQDLQGKTVVALSQLMQPVWSIMIPDCDRSMLHALMLSCSSGYSPAQHEMLTFNDNGCHSVYVLCLFASANMSLCLCRTLMQQPCPTACGLSLSYATTQEMLCSKLQPCTFAAALTLSPHRCLLPMNGLPAACHSPALTYSANQPSPCTLQLPHWS